MIQNARLKPSRISLFGGQFAAGTGHRQMLFHQRRIRWVESTCGPYPFLGLSLWLNVCNVCQVWTNLIYFCWFRLSPAGTWEKSSWLACSRCQCSAPVSFDKRNIWDLGPSSYGTAQWVEVQTHPRFAANVLMYPCFNLEDQCLSGTNEHQVVRKIDWNRWFERVSAILISGFSLIFPLN